MTNQTPESKVIEFLLLEGSTKEDRSYENRDEFITTLKAQGFKAVLFELDSNLSESADLVLFEDGSAFFADFDNGSYQPWPFEMAMGDNLYDKEEVLPALDDLSEIDFAALTGKLLDRAAIFERPKLEAWVRNLAGELPDPPEALRDFIVSPHQDFYWGDREGQARAQTLIAQFAQFYISAECEIMIRSSSEPGRTPIQKEHEKSMFEFMKNHTGFGSKHEREAMYGGHAYAEIESASGMGYQELRPANAALAWFSMRTLQHLGQPVGWDTDYNDQARNRMSGYSANSDAIVVELSDVLSNHERIRAASDISEFLAEIGQTEAFEAVRQDLELPPLLTSGGGAAR